MYFLMSVLLIARNFLTNLINNIILIWMNVCMWNKEDVNLFDYYCSECNKFCDFNDEIEFRAVDFEDDWKDFHIDCNSIVEISLKKNI